MLAKKDFSIDASQDDNAIILDFPFSPIESSEFLSETEAPETKEINKVDFGKIQPSSIQSKKIFKRRRTIDDDTRIKVIEGYKEGKTVISLAKLFKISLNSAHSIVRAFRDDGTIVKAKKGNNHLDNATKNRLIRDAQNGDGFRDISKRYKVSFQTETKICNREDQDTSVSSPKSKSDPEGKKSLICDSSGFKDAETFSINFNKTNQKEDNIDNEYL